MRVLAVMCKCVCIHIVYLVNAYVYSNDALPKFSVDTQSNLKYVNILLTDITVTHGAAHLVLHSDECFTKLKLAKS